MLEGGGEALVELPGVMARTSSCRPSQDQSQSHKPLFLFVMLHVVLERTQGLVVVDGCKGCVWLRVD